MLSHADLPNDIDALKALLLASEQVVRERDEVVSGLREQLTTSSVEIEHLKLMIAKLRRMQFGRKSEKLDHQIEQLELQLEDLQAAEGEAEREMPPTDRAPRAKWARKPLPDHLPRDEQVHAPAADACPSCGGGLRHLGEDMAEQLEFVPASFRVIRHVRPKLACTCCDTIVQAAGAEPADRARHRRTWPVGAHPGGQVRRPSAAVPAVGDLRARRRRARTRAAGELGRRGQRAAAPAGRRDPAPCAGRAQAARRRYPDSSAGTG